MQNTSRIQSITSTLMKNFFIVGVDQKTLISQIGEQRKEELKPQVLFSMYNKKDIVKNYLQFVFPEKMMIEFKPQDPKFYSFMSTDSEGFVSFFHCLIFYDEINDAEINFDEDNIEALRKYLLEHQAKGNGKSGTIASAHRKTTDGKDSGDEDDGGEGFQMPNIERDKAKKRLMQRKETTGFLDAKQLFQIQIEKEQLEKKREIDMSHKSQKSDPPTPIAKSDNKFKIAIKQQNQKKEEFNAFKSNILQVSTKGGFLNETNDKKISQLIPSEQNANTNKSYISSQNKIEIPYKNNGIHKKQISQSNQNPNSDQQKLDEQIKLKHQPTQQFKKEDTFKDSEDVSLNFGNLANVITSVDDYFGLKEHKSLTKHHFIDQRDASCTSGFGQRYGDKTDKNQRIEMDLNSDLHINQLDDNMKFTSEQMLILEQHYRNNNNNIENPINDMLNQKKYIPVAFCIETETEFHDAFREILLNLFEMIRVPEVLMNNISSANRMISFADFIAHLAFLRTIPSPPFNTIYNLQFLNQNIVIKENPFDQIPNKSSHAIKILLDVLDVRSIFYCWKALLFDKTLVLVSSQYSLQFYIAEALKQLLFPLTWQGSYIQPGNENLIELCDGTITMIYSSSNLFTSFDYFDGLSQGTNIMAICDIDASLTNTIELPQIHQEQMYLKLLNLMKNQRVSQYDMAFPQPQMENEEFVQGVRDIFFTMLKPYLVNINNCIKKVDDPSDANFFKYFDKAKYLEIFENMPCQLQFAKSIIESSQFIHFCDDYCSDELTNFQQMTAILKERGELNNEELTEKQKELDNKFQNERLNEEGVEDSQILSSDPPVIFNIRMPQDNQRILLFDKINSLIEKGLKKKYQSEKNKGKQEFMKKNLEQLKYEQIIQQIKKFYPIKLTGSHKKIQNIDFQQHQSSRDYKIINDEINGDGKIKKNYLNNLFEENKIKRESLKTPCFIPGQQKKGLLEKREMSYDMEDEKDQSNQSNQLQSSTNSHQKVLLPYFKQLNQNDINNQRLSNYDITQLSNSTESNYFQINKEQVENQSRKIVKLIYWQNGFLNFITHIFGLISEKKLREINYYFIFKEQLKRLKSHRSCNSKKKAKQEIQNLIVDINQNYGTLGIVVEEDLQSNDGNTPKNILQQKVQNNNMIQYNLSTQKMVGNQQYNQQIKQQLFQHGFGGQLGNSNCTKLSQTFKDQSEWISIQGWDQKQWQIKGTYQFILFKLKSFEMFECVTVVSEKILFYLMHFPSYYWQFFPSTKLSQIWNSLSHDQQEQIVGEYGWKKAKSIWGYYILKYYTESNLKKKSNGENLKKDQKKFANKVDESIFFKTHIERKKTDKDDYKANSFVKSQSSDNNISPDSKTCKQINKQEDLIRGSLKDKLAKRSSCISEKSPPSLTKFMQSNSKSNSKITQSSNSEFNQKINPSMASSNSVASHMTFQQQQEQAINDEQIFQKAKTSDDLQKFQSNMYNSNSIQKNLALDGKYKIQQTHHQTLDNPDEVAYKMLGKIIKFWKKNSQYVEEKIVKGFVKVERERIKEELIDICELLHYFSKRKLVLKDDLIRQVFFLNLFNFLVLNKFATLMACAPEGIELLNNFNMWQQFLISCQIVIDGVKIDANLIMMSFLRESDEIQISKLNIKMSESNFTYINNFKVKQPNQLIQFGLYLGIKGFPYLKRFTRENMNDELKLLAEDFISRKFEIKDNSNLIIAPINIKWIFKELRTPLKPQSLPSIPCILEYFANNVMSHKNQKFKRIAENIIKKYKGQDECEKNYIIYYKWCSWKIKTQKFKMVFASKSD